MKFKIPRVWWISTVILEWPPRRGELSEHWSTVQELSASVPVRELSSISKAQASLAVTVVCSLTDRLLGAVTGHPHGNRDEEMLELKDWKDIAARGLSAQRPPLPKGSATHTPSWACPQLGKIKALLRGENSNPGSFYL